MNHAVQVRCAVAQRDIRHILDGFPFSEPTDHVGHDQSSGKFATINLFFEQPDTMMGSLAVTGQNERPAVAPVLKKKAKCASHILISDVEYWFLYWFILHVS
jgi:hypothetical protein